MSGDQWTARLSEYIDGELTAGDHEALERHLTGCEECREIVAQLRRVRIRAGALEDRPPKADLWPGIAEQIGVNTGAWPVQAAARRRWSFSVPQLVAAGLAFLMVGAGGMWLAVRDGGAGTGSDLPRAVPLVSAEQRVESRLTGVIGYDHAIADLERVLAQNRDRLDSTTVRVLEESLTIIDRAILRAQDALAQDPGDVYLNTHLAETMRRKLALLRQAADLAVTSL